MRTLFDIDDMVEEIEARFNCKIEELTEDNCLEILEDAGIETEFARWNNSLFSIEYEIKEESDSDDVSRGWNEEYLNSIGMSMRDFF